MEWGSAADAERVYFPVADMIGPQAGQLHAVSLDNGQRVWMAPAPPTMCGEPVRGCSPAILAAISVDPRRGVRRIERRRRPRLLDEGRLDHLAVRHQPGIRDRQRRAAKGASINGPGPVVANGMVYINSGYGTLGGRAGNVLLAFGVD